MNRRFGKNDIRLLGMLAVVILVFYVGMTSALQSGDSIIITVNGSEYGRYSLTENKEIPIKIDGKVTNIVTIENGTAYMFEADCPDQLCMHQNAISKDKESIICLPNRVVVTVESEQKNTLDDVAG